MSNTAPTVRIDDGELAGTVDHGAWAYLGIPYAAAPFGELRMRPPAPPTPWQGVRDASSYGPTAPKGDYAVAVRPLLPEVFIEGEECLNLNVWVPAGAPGVGGDGGGGDGGGSGTGLPVFVWIHGGSFINGSGSVGVYRGSSFARDGVICVTINYRLQAEGFLHTGEAGAGASAETDAGADADAHADADASNLGLLDQLAALEWVQQNIHAFGGDPAKVTVGGESAGAMSVTTLLSMPRAKGLFRAAITQSGAAAHTMPAETGTKVAALLAEKLGIEPTRDAFRAVEPGALQRATLKVVAEVQTSTDRARWGTLALSLLPFMPTVDGRVLEHPPLESIADGVGGDVALLTGTNAEEFRLFLAAPGTIGLLDEPTAQAIASAYGVDVAEAWKTYRDTDVLPAPGPGDTLSAIATDWFFRVPAVRVAEARAENAARSGGSAAPTFMYRFDYRSTALAGLLGAAHAVEIAFAFDTLDTPDAAGMLGPNPPQSLADVVHAAWVRFIADGDPGWPAYEPNDRATMVFDSPDEGGVGGRSRTELNPDSERLALWEGIR